MATLYVTPTGSDSNNGTAIGTSKLTISGAIDAASNGSGNGYGNGDTILVYPSASSAATYYETYMKLSQWEVDGGYSLKKNLTIQAVTSSYPVTIDAQRQTIMFTMYHYTLLRGFICTGSLSFFAASSNAGDNALRNKYDQCTFTGLLEGSAISAPGASEVVACRFQTITGSSASILTSGNPSATPTYATCIFESCYFAGDTGFIIYNGAGTNEQVTVNDCHVTNSSGVQSSVLGTNNAGGNTNYNIIVSNSDYNASGAAIAGQGGTIKNCVVYNCSAKDDSTTNRTAATTTSNISNSDPSYVEASNGDYNIKVEGPAYNTGTSDATIANDFSGSAWEQNLVLDLDVQTTRNRDIGAMAVESVWQVSSEGYNSGSFVSSDFIIQNTSNTDVPLVIDSEKSGYPQTNQTLISLNVPGVPTLRKRDTPYKVTSEKG
jgi:hypothetical protein